LDLYVDVIFTAVSFGNNLALFAFAHPCADFRQPPVIAPIGTKLDGRREGNFWISLPTPERHVGRRNERAQLQAVDVPFIRQWVGVSECGLGC
jgi:hypothetical protein